MKIPTSIVSKKELQDYADSHKLSRSDLQDLYHSIPGAPAMKRIRNRPTAVDLIWQQIRIKRTTEPEGATKRAKLLEMLKAGATVDQMIESLGWQRHTLRGIVSTLQSKGVIKVVPVKEGARVIAYKGA